MDGVGVCAAGRLPAACKSVGLQPRSTGRSCTAPCFESTRVLLSLALCPSLLSPKSQSELRSVAPGFHPQSQLGPLRLPSRSRALWPARRNEQDREQTAATMCYSCCFPHAQGRRASWFSALLIICFIIGPELPKSQFIDNSSTARAGHAALSRVVDSDTASCGLVSAVQAALCKDCTDCTLAQTGMLAANPGHWSAGDSQGPWATSRRRG